jgi:hypothetical protein
MWRDAPVRSYRLTAKPRAFAKSIARIPLDHTHAHGMSKPCEGVMSNMKRKHEILHTLFSENPALAHMIREADEEGVALYGRAYVQGTDFFILTLEGNLLISDTAYEDMRRR